MKPKIKMTTTLPTTPGRYWVCPRTVDRPREGWLSYYKDKPMIHYIHDIGGFPRAINPELYFFSELLIEPNEFEFPI